MRSEPRQLPNHRQARIQNAGPRCLVAAAGVCAEEPPAVCRRQRFSAISRNPRPKCGRNRPDQKANHPLWGAKWPSIGFAVDNREAWLLSYSLGLVGGAGGSLCRLRRRRSSASSSSGPTSMVAHRSIWSSTPSSPPTSSSIGSTRSKSLSLLRMTKLVAEWLPPPRILHPWPDERFDVRHPR